MIVNNELERMWKEAVVAYFKVLFHNFYRDMEDMMIFFLHCSGYE